MRTWFRSLLVLAELLPVLIVLTPLAYASPPDPVWVSGFFDDADQDDVVVLVTSAGAAIDPFPLDRDWTAPAFPQRVCPGESPLPPTRHAPSCNAPRAPPAA
jgi:hypothetical protein